MITISKILANAWYRIIIYAALVITLAALFFSLSLGFINSTVGILFSLIISSFIIENFRNHSNFQLFGFNIDKFALKHILIGFLMPFIFFSLMLIIAFLLGYQIKIVESKLDGLIFTFFSIFILAVNEELLFRGIIFQALIEKFNQTTVTIVASLIFALLHFFNPNLSYIAIINIFLAGVLLSFMYIKTKSLWLPISFHVFWNYLTYFLLGMPVSGLYFGQSPVRISFDYNDFYTLIFGGDFGIEGSILVIPLLLFLIFYVLRYVKPSPFHFSKLWKRRYEEDKLKYGALR